TKAAPAPAPEKAPTPSPAPDPAPAQAPAQEPRVMPSARRARAEKGLAPQDVRASGPGGRILKEDVLVAPPAKPAASGAREEDLVPMTALPQRIAHRPPESPS